jgi:hypothetical protein
MQRSGRCTFDPKRSPSAISTPFAVVNAALDPVVEPMKTAPLASHSYDTSW